MARLACISVLFVLFFVQLASARVTDPARKKCTDKFSVPCAIEVYKAIFGGAVVSSECCRKVVSMGHTCHVGLLKSSPKYKENPSVALEGASKVWDSCSSIAQTPSN
jgi:hypothetical protein